MAAAKDAAAMQQAKKKTKQKQKKGPSNFDNSTAGIVRDASVRRASIVPSGAVSDSRRGGTVVIEVFPSIVKIPDAKKKLPPLLKADDRADKNVVSMATDDVSKHAYTHAYTHAYKHAYKSYVQIMAIGSFV